ncbi:MAG: GNAT family N-acetyltransferase [Rhizobacter sp.]|nr:GNAT family N-acetyltransferase [Rhizobacter sp.]
MAVEYTVERQPISPQTVEAIERLSHSLFDRPTPDLRWRLEKMPLVSVVCASVDKDLVAFKIGYAHSQSRYYSWLGGVHPDHRRQGVAVKLTELQHSWAKEQGFQAVETATDQANSPMTQANLKCGFAISGFKKKSQGIQVLFSKALVVVKQAPNPSIERTLSGLRPPSASHVKR